MLTRSQESDPALRLAVLEVLLIATNEVLDGGDGVSTVGVKIDIYTCVCVCARCMCASTCLCLMLLKAESVWQQRALVQLAGLSDFFAALLLCLPDQDLAE
jgi:hypothetical protein